MFKQNVYVCHSERCAKERSDSGAPGAHGIRALGWD